MGSCVHVSQAATNGRDSISPYGSLEPEQEDEEEEPSPPKQVCVEVLQLLGPAYK